MSIETTSFSPQTPSARKERRKAKLVGLVTSIVVAATPGVYSAWQSAKNAWQQRIEQKTRDTQEVDLQKNVESLEKTITALEKSCVSHKDLVELVLKIKDMHAGSRRRVHRSTDRERELEREIAEIKNRVAAAAKAKRSADIAKATKPKFKSPAAVRQMIQQAGAE